MQQQSPCRRGQASSSKMRPMPSIAKRLSSRNKMILPNVVCVDNNNANVINTTAAEYLVPIATGEPTKKKLVIKPRKVALTPKATGSVVQPGLITPAPPVTLPARSTTLASTVSELKKQFTKNKLSQGRRRELAYLVVDLNSITGAKDRKKKSFGELCCVAKWPCCCLYTNTCTLSG